jgi:two-component system OmpR family response regulator
LSNVKVLYVGDDVRLGDLIRTSLVREGFHVEQARDACSGVDSSRSGSYAVAIVDWNLSCATSELQAGRQLRAAAPEMRVILCTTAQRLRGYWRALTEACDEHLTTPFSSRELLTRVHRMVVRGREATGVSGSLSCGPIAVDFLRQSARVDGREIALQPLQLRLLGYLLRNAGRAVSSEELRSEVFRVVQSPGSTSVARQICVLRERLGAAGALIETSSGGYRIAMLHHAP